MSELKLVKVYLDHLELLRMFEIHIERILGFGKPQIVIVKDKDNQVHCGQLEKLVQRTDSNRVERDLVVHTYSSGYLFDDEIKELYLIGSE